MEFIKIYICNISPLNDEIIYKKAYNMLSCERQKKTDTYKFTDDKKRSVCAGCLLSYALKNENVLQLELNYTENSKPYLSNNKDIHFNLSHSGNYCVCVASSSPVGVDIEKIKEIDIEKIITRFSPEEAEHILKIEKEKQLTEFYNIWTKKESYIKFTGNGLYEDLTSFNVLNNEYYRTVDFNKEYCLSFYSSEKTVHQIYETDIYTISKETV